MTDIKLPELEDCPVLTEEQVQAMSEEQLADYVEEHRVVRITSGELEGVLVCAELYEHMVELKAAFAAMTE